MSIHGSKLAIAYEYFSASVSHCLGPGLDFQIANASPPRGRLMKIFEVSSLSNQQKGCPMDQIHLLLLYKFHSNAAKDGYFKIVTFPCHLKIVLSWLGS